MLCPGTSLEKPSMIADLSNRIKVKISGADRPTERDQNLSERRQILKYNQLFSSLLICLHVSFWPASITSVLHTQIHFLSTSHLHSDRVDKTRAEHHDNCQAAWILHFIYSKKLSQLEHYSTAALERLAFSSGNANRLNLFYLWSFCLMYTLKCNF